MFDGTPTLPMPEVVEETNATPVEAAPPADAPVPIPTSPTKMPDETPDPPTS